MTGNNWQEELLAIPASDTGYFLIGLGRQFHFMKEIRFFTIPPILLLASNYAYWIRNGNDQKLN